MADSGLADGLRVCTRCAIHHYENCGTCFGFGLYPGERELFPITARWAHGSPPSRPLPEKWIPCPECGSTPAGLLQDWWGDAELITVLAYLRDNHPEILVAVTM